jgi:hypothetical protein
MKPTIRIENWSIGDLGMVDPYKAPECRKKALCGHIPNHPIQGELKNAKTSQIVDIDLAGRRVETANSLYALGAIDPDYLAYALENSSKWTIRILKEVYA